MRNPADHSDTEAGQIGNKEPILLGYPPKKVRCLPGSEVATGQEGKRDVAHPRHPWRLRDRATRDCREDLRGQEPRDAGSEDVDRHTRNDVIYPETHRGDRMQQATEDTTQQTQDNPPPGPKGNPPPCPEPGPEDHHPLESDVDHAGSFREEPSEAGQQDRHPPTKHRLGTASGSELVGVVEALNEGQDQHTEAGVGGPPEPGWRVLEPGHAGAPANAAAAARASSRSRALRATS